MISIAMLINTIQSTILENLGRFTYLSTSQLQDITKTSLNYLRSQLSILKERKYISCYHVEITAKVRAQNVYYLLPLGRDCLLTYEKAFSDGIKVPASNPVMIVRDYHHRIGFIDTHIALYNYCQKHNITLETFIAYYDKQGNNRQKDSTLEAKTKVWLDESNGAFYIPDGLIVLEQNEVKRLFILEHFQDKYTNRIMQSLAKSAKAISRGTVNKKFDIQGSNARVLLVFAHEGIKHAVIKRLQQFEGFAPMSKLFFFATLEDVKKDFGNAWYTINNTPLTFL